MTTTENGTGTGRGRYWLVTDPEGRAHLIQAAPSGYVRWNTYTVQSPIAWLWHTVGTWLVNVLVFRRGWTVAVYRGDAIAPMRTRLAKHRHRTPEAALAQAERLALDIPRGVTVA